MNRLFIVMILTIVSMNCSTSNAFSAEDTTQIAEVIEKYMSALNQGRWDEAASYIHPKDRSYFRQKMISVIKLDDDKKFKNLLLSTLLGVPNMQQFETMTDQAVFARFLDNVMTTMKKKDTEAGKSVTDALSKLDLQIIGYVSEGNELLHVVYRGKMPLTIKSFDVDISMTELFTLRRYGLEWRIALPEKLNALFESMRQGILHGLRAKNSKSTSM